MDKTFRFSNSHADLVARDAQSIMGWRYHPSVMMKGGRGVKLIDVDGNEYYDLTSGMMSSVVGHAHPEIVETIKSQAELLLHESSWYSNPWLVELAELLGSTLPGDLKVVNFAVTGSEANEIAFRMALAKTGKYDIVSVIRGLHGGSLGVEAVTTVGGLRKSGLGPLMMPAKAPSILAPHCYRCPVNLTYPGCDVQCLTLSEQLMEYLTSKNVACVLTETVPASGGMIVPPKEWLPRMAELSRRWGALFVLDEVQMAPARTGKMWGFENFDVVPDIVTWGKGMSAGMAICGTITTKAIAEEVSGKCGLPWAGTYSGDPFLAAVALKQLQIVIRDKLAERSARLAPYMAEKLQKELGDYECVGDIRGIGMYRMLDIVKDRKSKTPDPVMAEKIRYNMMLEGVCTIAVKQFIRVVPPLIITEAEIDDAVGRMGVAVRRAMDGYPHDSELKFLGSLAEGQQFRPAAE